MRFFRSVSALSYEEAQRLCNVDFEKDVAFVAVVGPRENEEIIGTGALKVRCPCAGDVWGTQRTLNRGPSSLRSALESPLSAPHIPSTRTPHF